MRNCCNRLGRNERLESLSHDIFSRGNNFLKNVASNMDELPLGLHSFPEVAFIGRPNVGKSALVGALLHNHRAARVASKPGTTRKLTFWNVGDALCLVDTPGYGTWQSGVRNRAFEQARAFSVTRQYLSLRKSANLQQVYWVVGLGPDGLRWSAREHELLEYVKHEDLPVTFLLNKADRIGFDREKLIRHTETIDRFWGGGANVLVTAADTRHRGVPVSIDRLQHDIVYHCASPLTDEQLTFKDFQRELSYLPPSAAEKGAVEEAYPIEAHAVMPDDNRRSIASLVAAHNEEKAALLDGIRNNETNALIGAGEAAAIMAGDALSQPADITNSGGVDVDTVSSVVGVAIPKSMVPDTVKSSAAIADTNFEHYASEVGWSYDDVAQQDGFFTEKSVSLDQTDGGRRAPSRFKERQQKTWSKYIDLKRKKRNFVLHGDVVAPWLGQATGGVVGTTPTKGTKRVSGLKHGMMGGRQVAAKTLANKGRATKKVRPWAT